jgi:hypothetical protein
MGGEGDALARKIAFFTIGLTALAVSGAISYVWYSQKKKKYTVCGNPKINELCCALETLDTKKQSLEVHNI